MAGDQACYQIGRVFGEPLKHSRLGRRVGQDRWAKGEAYLRAKGGRAVFLGRFVGVLRALVPPLAGMSRMPHWGRKVAVWTVAVLVAGLVGVSQLYLGAQWLTDVLGALALGAAWLFAVLAAARTLRTLRTRTAKPPASADAGPAKAATPKRRSRS